MKASRLLEELGNMGIHTIAGVPDSTLKQFCDGIENYQGELSHYVAANEGAAVGLAIGSFLASGKPACVYMQNSGIGNAVNPLLSLTDSDVYGIPLLLIIGWRGEPGVKDEPQHVKQGKTTLPLLETMGIEYQVLDTDTSTALTQLEHAAAYMVETSRPYALVVRKDTFETYKLASTSEAPEGVISGREEAIASALGSIPENAVIVSTTGMISRELFETREARGEDHSRDFLTVGSMGHASQIALGIALARPKRPVYCFDGDGATIMHMGSLGINGQLAPANLVHIVFNNGAHDSVGGQPTIGFRLDLPAIAKATGYRNVFTTTELGSMSNILEEAAKLQGPTFIEVKVRKGARKDLGRPTTTPADNKQALMKNLADD